MTIRVGRWLGPNGGGLEILSIGPGAHFTGRYQTKVGLPDPNAWFDAHGMTDGALIGFTVLWKNQRRLADVRNAISRPPSTRSVGQFARLGAGIRGSDDRIQIRNFNKLGENPNISATGTVLATPVRSVAATPLTARNGPFRTSRSSSCSAPPSNRRSTATAPRRATRRL